MDITIPKGTLSSLLARAASVAASKSPQTYLTCALIEAAEGRLTVRATNLMIGVEASGLATVKTPGALAVDARRLAEISKAMPAGEVRLRLVKSQLEVTNGKSKFKLGTYPADDFPPMLRADKAEPVVQLKGADLARLVTQCSYCMETDDSRPNAAMKVVVTKEHVRSYAGQSTRMATAEVKTGGLPCSLLFPPRSVQEIKTIAESSKDDVVTVSKHVDMAFFASSDQTLSLKLADDNGFPPMDAIFYGSATGTVGVLPSLKHEARFARDNLLASFQRVHIVANKAGDAISVYGSIAEGELRLTGASSASDEGEDIVQCEHTAPLDFEVAPEFVEAALKALDDDEVLLGYGGPADPLVFRGTSGDYVAIVMTMSKKR